MATKEPEKKKRGAGRRTETERIITEAKHGESSDEDPADGYAKWLKNRMRK